MDTLGRFSQVAVYALGIILPLSIFALSYQLVLHPLKNYPGPFIAKFTDGYGGYHAVKKRLHLATYFDHLKYGPVYRQAPNRLVFNTSSALRALTYPAIYLHPSINKAHIYTHTQFNPQANIFGTLERERHRQKLAWPIMSKTWPLLRRLNRKNGVAFSKSIQSIIQRRVALPQDAKHDFYSIAGGEVGEDVESLGRSELWAEAVFFIPAGGTTLSTALSSLFFYLSRHPTAYTLLTTEVRDTFSSSFGIKSGAQLSSCKYLRACIDETLRMAPPFLATFWREPFSDYTEPFVVDGHVIPRGTMVGVNPYCVMHNEEYFPEPFAFRPERWLVSEKGSFGTPKEEQNLASMRAAFAPFALGDTGCLGKAMAYHEISLAIAKTLWYFDFEKASGEAGKLGEGQPGNMDGRDRVDEYQLFDLAVADHDGPNLMFIPREEYWRELGDEGLKVLITTLLV
ncbi:hypothetical protein SS1G_05490 [Sclerotinia sclerotiorum 1980 UF-70]|uniref:Cytochrome P450 monooxygenase n=1 Tax=Sclerotinia sclerotiorum (strain ATCC 18683 / 1980 / Ss-1) TaxID=665079 RepID=A7EJJ7_SCLS1|nr:hypothetical protein SS1G_05490 [Sclerotinia sclerotiorum 1980 UF-70]EDO03013.1 hypothetical protein SS1G_05490 [Sclerotinia sclerotiorum 1980 UF-70]